MLTSALKHIAEDLAMPEQDLGRYLGTIRLGALPAILLVPLADQYGRRRLFLGALRRHEPPPPSHARSRPIRWRSSSVRWRRGCSW
jgi:hypothetical protein